MKRLFQSIPFLNAFVPEIKNESKGIYFYGKNNLLPNELMTFILNSGIAKRCNTKIKTYIASDGFVDSELNKIKVNEKQTALELLDEAAGYAAYFGGCAFHVSRKSAGDIGGVKVVPFQCVRKRLDGNFEVNLTYGQPKFDLSQSKIFAPFGGKTISPIELKKQVENKEIQTNGEILYVYLPNADNAHYPVPDYYAGIEDIRSSAELSKFDLETIINGFITSAILTMVGDIDDTTEDESGMTEKDYLDQELAKFTGKQKDSQGLSGRMKLLVLNAASKDEMPVLQSFDSKAIMEASNSKRDIIDRTVCRLMGVHPVLMGFSDAAVLGNQQAMANASLELNKVVDPLQRMLENAFSMLIPDKEWKITEYTPITYYPSELIAKMTEDEVRMRLGGLPPIERDAPTEQDKILSTLNSLSPLIATEIIKAMPQEELLKLVGIKAKPVKTDPNVTQ